LDAKRDWGHARDFVEMQWLMLQQDAPEDYVISTGQQYSVREFVNLAAEEIGMRLTWRGHGVDEKAVDQSGRTVVAIDRHYFRPAEVDTLLGDSTKARTKLGWRPKTSFREMISEMVRTDLQAAERDRLVRDAGYRVHQHSE
jgi:GDPmannose 4,6-dehydratase